MSTLERIDGLVSAMLDIKGKKYVVLGFTPVEIEELKGEVDEEYGSDSGVLTKCGEVYVVKLCGVSITLTIGDEEKTGS